MYKYVKINQIYIVCKLLNYNQYIYIDDNENDDDNHYICSC